MKQYRIQRSDHQGVVTRAFGGRVASWSKWRTVSTHQTLGEASTAFSKLAGRGLSRTRLVYGAEVLAISR